MPRMVKNRKEAFGRNKLDLRDKSLLRLIKFGLKRNKIRFVIVAICIVVSAIASTIASTFLQRLIDDCIIPGM